MAKTKVKDSQIFDGPASVPVLSYKYLCPACTNEALFDTKPWVMNQVFCKHCGLTKPFDASRWVLMA